MKLKNCLLFSLLILASCLAEQNNPLVIASCFDGVKNQDEVNVDCGGKCTACPTTTFCPGLVDNLIKFNNKNLYLTSSDYEFKDYSGIHIEVNRDNLYIYIDVNVDVLLRKTVLYQIDPDDIYGYANITISSVYGESYDATSGGVYLIYENNKWTVEFCSVNLVDFEGVKYPISGRIPLPK